MESASGNVAAHHHHHNNNNTGGGTLHDRQNETCHEYVDNDSRYAQHDDVGSQQRQRYEPPSGLSALIMAATSQLSYLAEVACSRENELIETAKQITSSSSSSNRTDTEKDDIRAYTQATTMYNESDSNIESAPMSSRIERDIMGYQNHEQSTQVNNNNHNHQFYQQDHQVIIRQKLDPTSSSSVHRNETTPTIVPETKNLRKLTFPETLMTLASRPDYIDTITFLPDGKFFAIRPDKFTEQILSMDCFDPIIQTYSRFLDVMNDWGFTGPLDPATGMDIAVFRHPHFIKGEWERCSAITCCADHSHSVRFQSLHEYRGTYGHPTTMSSVTDDSSNSHPHPSSRTFSSAHNDSNSTSDDCSSHVLDSESKHVHTVHSKRRLSPSFLARRDSVSSVSSQKQKIDFEVEMNVDSSVIQTRKAAPSIGSGDDSETIAGTSAGSDDASAPQGNSFASTQLDEVRSKALAITTEKLKLHQSSSRRNSILGRDDTIDESYDGEDSNPPLIDQAVSSATHSIVTNAIATLLRDESHTKETYLKHEKELSKSCIPGVIPISTQLFSPASTEPLAGTRRSSTASAGFVLTSTQTNPPMTLPLSSLPNAYASTEPHSLGAIRRNSLNSYNASISHALMSSTSHGTMPISTPMNILPSSLVSTGTEYSSSQPPDSMSIRRNSLNSSNINSRRPSLPIPTIRSNDSSATILLNNNDQAAGIDTLMNLRHHFSSSYARRSSTGSTHLASVDNSTMFLTRVSESNGIDTSSISRSVTDDSQFLEKTS